MKDKSSTKAMNMHQSSMDSNVPQPKSMFPGEAKYTGNVKGSFPLAKQSVTAATIGKTKGGKSSMSGHTAPGLIRRDGPKASIKK